MTRRITWGAALPAALFLLLVAGAAQATIVAQGSAPFAEPNGFYSGVKSFTVYTHDDVNNPAPGAAGELTYVYTISNDVSSTLGIIGFNIDTPVGGVVDAGWVDDADLATPPPFQVVNNNDGVVRWDWAESQNGIIDPGDTADELYIISTYTPGGVNDTIYSLEGEFAFDLQGLCVGPLNEPADECDLEVVKEACVVQPPPVPGDACEGKAVAFDFEYTGLGCDASSHLQDPHKTWCFGGADGDEPVDIIVYGKKHRKHWGWWGHWNRHKRKMVFARANDVMVGDTITVDAANAGKNTLGSSVKIKIKAGDSHHLIELDKLVTNCREPLAPGNQFGSALITSLTSTEGGTVTLPEDPPSEDCVTSIDIEPAPHCEGKIKTLTLRYLGGDCTNTMMSASHGFDCFDPGAATTAPVRVIVSDGASAPPGSTAYVDVQPIEIGDLIEIDASDAGHSHFTSTTGFWIKKASDNSLIQDGYFRTDCDKPLNLGDRIGALEVFALETTQGGSVALGRDVEYTYEVTNPNGAEATDVLVDDDVLGIIASGETIAAGDTETYVETALIEEETTNTVTVTGEVNGVQCNAATAMATITVNQPEPPDICTTRVQAMSLLYTGPTVYGATVKLRASKFFWDEVVYSNVDLISGVTVLTKPAENGFTIDATQHGEVGLGSWTKVYINGDYEKLDTSCAKPFETGQPAPLYWGGTSDLWTVDSFTQKD